MSRTTDCCEIACSLESRYKANDCWSWSCITSPVSPAVSTIRPPESAAGGPEGRTNLRLASDAQFGGQVLSGPARFTAASSSIDAPPGIVSSAVRNRSGTVEHSTSLVVPAAVTTPDPYLANSGKSVTQ